MSEQYSIDFFIQEENESDDMEDEMIPVFEYINSKLNADPQLKHIIPMDATSISSCMKAIKDGHALW